MGRGFTSQAVTSSHSYGCSSFRFLPQYRSILFSPLNSDSLRTKNTPTTFIYSTTTQVSKKKNRFDYDGFNLDLSCKLQPVSALVRMMVIPLFSDKQITHLSLSLSL